MATLQELQQKAALLRQQDLAYQVTGGNFDNLVDRKRGAPAAVRTVVGSVTKPEDRLANLRRYYPEALPYGEDNFVFIDRDSGRPTLYNPPGFMSDPVGDIASIAPEIGEAGGGVLGGAVGSSAGPAGTIAGVGLGAAAGREAVEQSVAANMGRIDTRNFGEHLTDTAMTASLNAAGQKVGDMAVEGVRRVVSRAPEIARDFTRANVNPRSAGTVSGSRGIQFLEQGIGSTIAGGDVIARRSEQTLDEVAQRVTELADIASPARTTMQAGAALKRGGREYIAGFKAEADRLEGEFAKLVPPGTPVDESNTLAALSDVGAAMKSDPELGKTLTDPKFQRWLEIRTRPDAPPLPFEEMRYWRSYIGRKLGEPQVLSDIPRGELKRLYAGMTADMRAEAARRGPKALEAFDKATRFERQGFKRIEDALEEIAAPDSAVNAERIYAMVQNLAQAGGKGTDLRKLALIRRSVPIEHWKATAAVTLRKMGQARPNMQDATGGQFSANTFMTEWNKLSPEARNILFRDVVDPGWVESMNGLSRVMRAMKSLDQQANSSGTARVLQAMGTVGIFGGAAGSMLAGDVSGAVMGAAAGIGGRIVAPHVAARLMTSEPFVRWLMQAGSQAMRNPGGWPQHLVRLGAIAEAEPEMRDAIKSYVEALRAPPAQESVGSAAAPAQ